MKFRHRTSLLCSLFAGALFVPSLLEGEAGAQEQGFAIDRFNPSARGSDWFSTDSLDLRGGFRPAFGLVFDYAYRPLFFERATPAGEQVAASTVRNQLFMHAGASFVIADRLRIAANLPIGLYTFGHPLFAPNVAAPAHDQQLGDLGLAADVRLLGTYGDPFTLAIGAEVFLPTGNRDDYTSDGDVRVAPHLLFAGAAGAFVYAGRLSYEYRGLTDDFANVKLGSEIGGGASVGLRTPDNKFVIGPEISASTILSSTPANPNTGIIGQSPADAATAVEGLLGAHVRLGDFRLGAGGGVGLTRAYGTPVSRGLLSLEWVTPFNEDRDGDGILDKDDACPDVRGIPTGDPHTNGCPAPPPPPPDRDGDGIVDASDACPDVPGVPSSDPAKNGCPPDRDNDGIPDAVDACPDVPGVRSDDPKKNGCPSDRDGDGVIDTEDACPDQPGLKNADPKLNGCPDPDRDKDGIPNDVDACPDEPGKPDPNPKKNGCPIAYVKNGEIKITQQVKFKTGSDAIVPGKDSEDVLNAVVAILQKHTEITKLRVEGHTDNVGKPAMNKVLSTKRAAAVVKWLGKHGIDKARMTSVGFGQDRPIEDNATAEGRTENRRVEFHIEGGDATTPPSP